MSLDPQEVSHAGVPAEGPADALQQSHSFCFEGDFPEAAQLCSETQTLIAASCQITGVNDVVSVRQLLSKCLRIVHSISRELIRLGQFRGDADAEGTNRTTSCDFTTYDAVCQLRLSRAELYLLTANCTKALPASAYEDSPAGVLLGHDPEMLCKVALRDAGECLALSKGRSSSCSGEARQHVERVVKAALMLRIAVAKTLSLPVMWQAAVDDLVEAFPTDAASEQAYAEMTAAAKDCLPSTTRPSCLMNTGPSATLNTSPATAELLPQLQQALECSLCMSMFSDPVTLSCGHTFCRQCLLRALDYSLSGGAQVPLQQRCPFCRAPTHVDPMGYPSSVVIKQVVELLCGNTALRDRQSGNNDVVDVDVSRGSSLSPDQRDERASCSAPHQPRRTCCTVPIFVLTMPYPFHPSELNVFEPRYRVMIRRCLEGSKKFGMVDHEHLADFNAGQTTELVGGLVQILSSSILPDGRYHIQYAFSQRFVVTQLSEVDGYRVASVELFSDIPPPESSALQSCEALLAQIVENMRLSDGALRSIQSSTPETKSLFLLGLASSAATGNAALQSLVTQGLRTTSLAERMHVINTILQQDGRRCTVM